MTSRLESVIFKMPNKVLIEETNKNLANTIPISWIWQNSIPIVKEDRTLVLFWNETYRDVMNFKNSFLSSSKFSGHSYRPVTLLRAGAQH